MLGGGETMDKVRVLLASNRELWWEGLLLLVKERAKDIDILAISYNAVETIDKANRLNPDVILLDEEIEGGDCGEVAQRINELNPEIKIITVIKPYKDVSLSTSFKARAKAYIDKDITYTELENCVRYVAKGGVVVISPFVARKLIEQLSYYGTKMSTRVEYDVGLSKREREVLALLTKRGITNREIADALHISEHTVKAHLSRVMEKMKVRNRQQAAILAREKGVVPEAGGML
jgi:DNA-binding NarL/FixJ family response regulator